MKYSAFVVMPVSKGSKLEKSKSKVQSSSRFGFSKDDFDFRFNKTSPKDFTQSSRQQTADGLSDGIPSHTPGYFRSL
jgi:hypothetical protein